MQSTTRAATLAQAIFPRTGILRDAGLILGFSLMTALFARIAIPVAWSPVPITGQTFAVLLAGAVLGSRKGALSMLTYAAIGATGIPYWFTAGSTLGVARLAGPSGGFIIGFIPAAFVVGYLAERGWDRRFWTAALAMLLGEVVLYAVGLPWMARFAAVIKLLYDNAAKEWTWLGAVPGSLVFKAGVLPYIPGDLIKLFLAAQALPSAWVLVNRWRR